MVVVRNRIKGSFSYFKSVFTRVTDGRRLLYYSVYVVGGVAAVSATAISLHFFIAGGGTTTAEA